MNFKHIYFTLVVFVLTGFNAFGQVTEGKIVYTISYPESELDEQTMSIMPKESISYFKNDKMRIDMTMGMGMNNSILVDNSKKEVHILMDMMGNKMDMKMTEKDIEKEVETQGEYKVVKTEEVRDIAGYKCRKAIVTGKNQKSFTVWYTKEINVKNSNWNNQFKNIDGFLMEFRMNHSGLTMEMTAKSVSVEKVSDDHFEVPPGYKEMSGDDLKRMSQGK